LHFYLYELLPEKIKEKALFLTSIIFSSKEYERFLASITTVAAIVANTMTSDAKIKYSIDMAILSRVIIR